MEPRVTVSKPAGIVFSKIKSIFSEFLGWFMVVGAGRPTKTCYSPAKPVLSVGPRKSPTKFHSGDQYHNKVPSCVFFYDFIYFRNSD